jgi:NADH-dependent peroxiredoxin subunit F
MTQIYDTIILGGGPAAAAAAIYAARKKMKTVMIAQSIGGQSVVSNDIQNWIGEPHIAGFDLAQKLEAHLKAYPDILELKIGVEAKNVSAVTSEDGRLCDFLVKVDDGQEYKGRTLIICTGASRRRLNVPGEKEFAGRGVAYCSTCDAPLFINKDVAVVGGGNAGLESVQDLLMYANKIYLLENSAALRGDKVTQDIISQEPKVKIILNAAVKEIVGDKLVSGLKYLDTSSNDEKTLAVQGVFVEIGSMPNSDLIKDLVKLDNFRQIVTDMKYATTSHVGVFAAGDVTDDPFKQNNISVGDGVRAALSAYNYLLDHQKSSSAAG